MESNDKLKIMNVNKEILMTIVRNSGGRLEGDQEILEINEQQLSLISKELTKLFSIHSVVRHKFLDTYESGCVEHKKQEETVINDKQFYCSYVKSKGDRCETQCLGCAGLQELSEQ